MECMYVAEASLMKASATRSITFIAAALIWGNIAAKVILVY